MEISTVDLNEDQKDVIWRAFEDDIIPIADFEGDGEKYLAWKQTGASLMHLFGEVEGFDLWNRWSRGGSSYDESSMDGHRRGALTMKNNEVGFLLGLCNKYNVAWKCTDGSVIAYHETIQEDRGAVSVPVADLDVALESADVVCTYNMTDTELYTYMCSNQTERIDGHTVSELYEKGGVNNIALCEATLFLDTLFGFDSGDIIGVVCGMWNEGKKSWEVKAGGYFDGKEYVTTRFIKNHFFGRKNENGSAELQLLKSEKDGANTVMNHECGVWIRSCQMDGKGSGDKNVSSYSYILLESDDQPPVVQERFVRASGLPCATMVDSGNKSIHCLIRVNAEKIDEYHRYFDILETYAANRGMKLDKACRNPSHLTRFAGFKRGERRQRLLDINIGAKDLVAWFETEEGKKALREYDQRRFPDPIPLDCTTPPEFTLRGLFPAEIEELLDDFSAVNRYPREYAYVTLLGTFSYILQDKARVRSIKGNHFDPVNLFTLIVGAPSVGKSETYKPFCEELLESWIDKKMQEWKTEVDEKETEIEILRNEIAQLMRCNTKHQSAENQNSETTDGEKQKIILSKAERRDTIIADKAKIAELEAQIPPSPSNIYDDATPEAIARKLASSKGIGGILTPEAQILQTLLGAYAKSGRVNIDVVLRAFGYENYTLLRVGGLETGGMVDIQMHVLLTCMIFAQPQIASSFLNDSSISGRGAAGRFLVFWPKEIPHKSTVGEPMITPVEDIAMWRVLKSFCESMLDNTESLYFGGSEETRQNTWKECTLFFDSSINQKGTHYAAFVDRMNYYRENNPTTLSNDDWKGIVGRQEQIAQRIAAVLHIVRFMWECMWNHGTIDLGTLREACRIPINSAEINIALDLCMHSLRTRIASSTVSKDVNDIVEFCRRVAQSVKDGNAKLDKDGHIVFCGAKDISKLMRFGDYRSGKGAAARRAELLEFASDQGYILHSGKGKTEQIELNPKLFTPEVIANPSLIKEKLMPNHAN